MRADTKGLRSRDHHIEAARLVSRLGSHASDVGIGWFVHLG